MNSIQDNEKIKLVIQDLKNRFKRLFKDSLVSIFVF